MESGIAIIESHGQRVTANLEGLRAIGSDSVAPGMSVAALLPKESSRVSPGFYVAFGNRDLQSEILSPLGRFYFNVSSDHACKLLRCLTELLNNHLLPFRLKVLSDPTSYSRTDCAVLYVNNADVESANRLIRDTYDEIAPFLRSSVPALTKWLAPGVGAALDPGNGESFGTYRCKLLATHIFTSLSQGVGSNAKRTSFVFDRLKQDGVLVAKPYLQTGYGDPFRVIATRPRPLRPSTVHGIPQAAALQTNSFRKMAIQIGIGLAESAYWCADSCNWIAEKSPWETERMGGTHPVTYEALNVDLYGGTSGVGLFLAQVARLSGVDFIARAARGAIIHSLTRVKSRLGARSTGLYTGWPGVLLTGAYVGTILRDPLLVDMTLELWSHFRQNVGKGSDFDLLSGDAGAVIALLGLDNLHLCAGALELAAEYGDSLIQRRCETPFGKAWRSTTFSDAWPLTGLSHGASGVGYALMELYRQTHDDRYLAAAMDGFAYERAWYSERHGNWADLRNSTVAQLPGKQSLHYNSLWCHGAPGVALSRIRALEIIENDDIRTDATRAIRTTCAEVERAVNTGASSLCLCHGLAGNADVMLQGEVVLADGRGRRMELACEAARQGIASGAGTLGAWVSDRSEQWNPSLMLGLAGVGYFYLRMAEPATPSVLLFRPEFVPS
ncbi:MAG: T3SS effector HopA1 family protein [Acidobacteriota bacterium]|nr:T3SS effector HopA1 family protein [Acidobacteriota bacterium]